MDLVGVEFTDFACFDRRFVPIRPGVQVLVGRNNAGKTALLRGLGALSGLPVGQATGRIEPELQGYTRNSTTNPSFGLNVWFTFGSDDWSRFAYNQSQPFDQ